MKSLSDLSFLLVFGLFFCLYQLGAGSLASWDEAIYAQVARDMVQSGDYVHLTVLGVDWYSKPPLYMWGTAFFYHLFGVSEFSARLFSALSGVAVTLLTYILGRLFFGRMVSLIGAGILLSSTDFLHYSRWAVTDITHLLFFTAAVYAFFKARSQVLWYYAFWAASGLAFMTKGPVIVLVFPILLIHGWTGGGFGFLKNKHFWLGLIPALIIVLPWHAAAYAHDPRRFMDYIGYHMLSRAMSTIEGHAGGYYFYIRTLINKYHPWVVFLPFAVVYLVYRAAAKKEEGSRLLLTWIAVILGVFTFAVGTKLRWYILPCYPALSLAVGVLLAMRWSERYAWLAKAMVALALILHIPFSSVIVQDYSPGLKALGPRIRSLTDSGATLYLYNFHDQPAAVFYTQRPAHYADSIEELDRSLREAPRMVLYVPAREYSGIADELTRRGFRIVARADHPKLGAVLATNFTKPNGGV